MTPLIPALLLLFSSVLLPLDTATASGRDTTYAWLTRKETAGVDRLHTRFPPPQGYRRVPLSRKGFGFWLRRLPLEPRGARIRLYNGGLRSSQGGHAAVVKLDIGRANLQQCADAVIRLWAEFQWSRKKQHRLGFRFTSGHWFPLLAWESGYRPILRRGKMRGWRKRARPRRDYAHFRKYLVTVMMYAGTWSLSRELSPVSRSRLSPGDVLLQGGFPGHAVLILDQAVNKAGDAVFLLGQSYMPAQSFHVLRGKGRSPWRSLPARGAVRTPDWTFPQARYFRLPPKRGRFVFRPINPRQ